MHIVLVDDSIPFDGETPAREPLGGAEKAFASLPGALARRGHRVQVFNHAIEPREIEGASWESWQGTRETACDVLIAHRDPELLGFVATARHRILWLAGPARLLDTPARRGLLEVHRATLVFLGEAHRKGWRDAGAATRSLVVAPGLRPDYLAAVEPAPLRPPYAVATCHPLLGLDWLIELWAGRIHPACPHAELRLYSAVLDKALRGEPVAEPFKPVAALALAARDKGIAIRRPEADAPMAEAYRGARAHLHPGDRRELFAYALAESQACGLPAVARPSPAAAERVADGVSGLLAEDDEAFARAVLGLLEDDAAYRRLGPDGRAGRPGRSWDEAAAAFEAIWT